MFAGHFGLAAIVKAKNPEVPLWTLMLGTQLLDIAFVPLLLSGIETIEPADSTGVTGYGESIIHADYTHSLIGALFIAFFAGALAHRFLGKRSGWIIGSVVFSHWLLDLLVHREDLPLLPGNLGSLPLLGFGLWRYPSVSAAFELILVVIGLVLYTQALLKGTVGRTRIWAMTAGGVMGLLLVLSLVTDVLGIG